MLYLPDATQGEITLRSIFTLRERDALQKQMVIRKNTAQCYLFYCCFHLQKIKVFLYMGFESLQLLQE